VEEATRRGLVELLHTDELRPWSARSPAGFPHPSLDPLRHHQRAAAAASRSFQNPEISRGLVGAARRSRHRSQWRARVEARCATTCGDPGNGDELEVPMQIREGPSWRPTPSPAGALQSLGVGDLRWRGVDPPAPGICGGGAGRSRSTPCTGDRGVPPRAPRKEAEVRGRSPGSCRGGGPPGVRLHTVEGRRTGRVASRRSACGADLPLLLGRGGAREEDRQLGRAGRREEEAVGMKNGERDPENAAPKGWKRKMQHGLGVLLEPVQWRLVLHFSVAD
jgi:hypothetical protein